MATTLADICPIRYTFLHEKFAKIVCQALEIKPQCLIKPKGI